MVRRSETIGGMDAFTTPPAPINEPNLTYAPGTPERAALEAPVRYGHGPVQLPLDADAPPGPADPALSA